KTLYWSEEVFRIFGLNPQDGIPDYDETRRLVHPDDLNRVSEERLRGFLGKVEFSQEYRIQLQNGTVKHLQVVWHPVLDSAGELVEYIGTAADTTKRQKAEQKFPGAAGIGARRNSGRESRGRNCFGQCATGEAVWLSTTRGTGKENRDVGAATVPE